MRSQTSLRPDFLVRQKFLQITPTRFFLSALAFVFFFASLYFAPALLSRRQTPSTPAAAALPLSPDLTGELAVGGQSATGENVKAAAADVAQARVKDAYGRLPIAFEENAGQHDGKVKYSARGSGFQLFLTSDEAVLSLRKPSTEGGRDPDQLAARGATARRRAAESRAVLRMKLVGANRRARVTGEEALAAKSNYFIGAKPENWQTGVATYERVRYAEVYPGIDVVYYGNQRQLEYDFVLAPHTDPARIKFKFSGARDVRLDAEGHLSLQTARGYVRQEKPLVYQLVDGRRQEIAGRYAINESGEIGFELGRYDRSRPLVIDPVLSYSTYLGGTGNDQALGIALDGQGNAYITGQTASSNFPTLHPVPGGDDPNTIDAFVLKLNPAGNALVYATYLGGNGDDNGRGIAVDTTGNAYVTGDTLSNNFPLTPGTVQDENAGIMDAFVAKLSAAGDTLSYSSYLGGENFDAGYAIAVDATGNAYVTGDTDSFSFLDGLAMPKQGSPVYKSGDAGANWSPRKSGLFEPNVAGITVDPTNPSILYAAASSGVFKSFDGGNFWSRTGLGNSDTPFSANTVVVDPITPTTLYVATFGGVYKSTNGGEIWKYSSLGMDGIAGLVICLAIDPNNTSTLYAGTYNTVYKSVNGGASWARSSAGFPSNSTRVNRIIFDPTDSKIIYAAANFGVYKSVNSGTSWSAVNNGLVSVPSGPTLFVSSLAISPTSPNTIYAGTTIGVYKSTDGGLNWALSSDGLRAQILLTGTMYIPPITDVVISPASESTLYASSSQGGVFKSTDGGASWAASNNGLANIYVTDLAIDQTAAATLYASANSYSDIFVIKLDPTGTDVGYVRYLGGNEYDSGQGIAVDAGGNAYLTGETRSLNFQTLNAAQTIGGGVLSDAFVTKLGSDGATLYSTYLGGSGSDQGFGIAVGASGNAYVTGSTNSTNFPTAGPRQTSNTSGTEAFVSKLSASGASLDFSIYHGGHATDQGYGIALDGAGNVYVTGATSSSDFPTANSVQPAWGGGNDAFVLKLSPMSEIIYSTYVGGSGNDQGFGIAVDANGAAHIAGSTTSFNFPTSQSPLQAAQRGGGDAFVAKIGTSVDLSVTMTDAPDPVTLGGDLTYTIKVANVSELPATGVRLTDTLPAGSALVSASTSAGVCSGTNPVVCELGSLSSGASATVTIVIKPPAAHTVTNTASVTANESEVITANNTATQETIVDFADLSMTAGALQGFVVKGGRVTYVLGVSNNRGSTATNVQVNVGLPPGLTLVSCTAPGGTCGNVGNNLTATFPTLAVNATQSVVIVADVSSNVGDNTAFSIIATASSALPDPDPSNNSAGASASVSTNVVQPKSNGKIAFTLLFEGVYVMDADGTNVKKIYSETGGRYSLATWSPDGTKIAFINEPQSSNFSTFEVRVINADGSGHRLLSTNGTLDSRPTWSPNSEFVGFVSRDRKSFQIVNAIQVADPAGTPAATTLFNTNSILEEVSWSPDGTKLLYGAANAEIWTANVDGSNPKLLDSDPNTSDRMPVWSPDGTKILFLRNLRSSNTGDVSIYTMNADGTNAMPLPNPISGTSSLKRPVFSPDGTQIAYEYPVSINGSGFLAPGILKANADGTNITRVPADGQGGSAPSWQGLPASAPPPTPAPTFKISGRVTPPTGQSSLISGFVRLDLTGSRTASAFPDSNGNYSFTLPAGGNYTITPVVNPYYNFSPGSYTFNNLSADQPDANFNTTRIIYSIRGRVTDTSGAPLSNVEVNLNRFGALVGTQRTGQDGSYLFDDLQPNTSYTVLVPLSSRANYEFEPDARVLNLTQSEVVNFVGTPKNNFQFAADPYIVGEGDGHVTVVVTRAGTPSSMAAPASVTVQTYDDPADVPCDPTLKRPDGTAYPAGTAYARCDYATTVETLTFAPGETQKTVNIPIIDDVHVEGTEVVPVRLHNPVGATAGGTLSGINVVIHDNDSGTAQNPTRTTAFFVRMHYLDFLSREPEPSEPWSRVLNNCPNAFNLDPLSPSAGCDRLIVSQSFFGSPEFRLKGFFVYNFYRVAFDRRPEYAEIIPDMSSLAGATAAEVYARRAALPVNFTARQEFKTRYDGLSDAAFVGALFDRYGLQQITTPDPQQPEASARVVLTRGDLINRLGASGAQALTRAQVLRAVVESNEVIAAEYNGAFVAMQYYGYLRRTPEESGYQAWLRVINQDPNNVRIMVNGFLNSTEYRLRFGQP